MSGRTKNFRRRTCEDSADDDKDSTATNQNGISSTKSLSKPSTTTTPAVAASKPKPTKPPKLLSFADDEDEDDDGSNKPTPKIQSRSSAAKTPSSSSSSRLAKPSSSHQIITRKERSFHSSSSSSSANNGVPHNVQPQAGTYTKEALRELQKNTRTLGASSSKPHPEPVIVLRGLVKPAADKPDEPESSDSEDEAKAAIPDQAAIDAIRAKRERLRQARAAAPDFISLDGGIGSGSSSRRAEADDGLSDEEPENLTRIALLGDKAAGPGTGVFEAEPERAVTVAAAAEREAVVSEEDEEEKIWEEEQFRKGLGKNRIDAAVQRETQLRTGQSSAVVAVSSSIGGAAGGPSEGLMSITQQGEIAKKALIDNVKMLKESYGKTVSLLNKTDENWFNSRMNITALEKSLAAADEKYRFMQKLRDFVSIICDFLQHKAPFIEELEDQMQKLHEKRASAIVERRALDNDDEMAQVEAEVNAAMSIFNRRGGGSDIVAAAKSAAQVASAALREQANLPVKLDELGRDMNLQKRMEMKSRAEARARKKARFDAKRLFSMDLDSPYQRVEGESSSDESDSESTAFNSHRDLLLETAAHIFSDASEEYSNLSVVKEKFEEWKRDHLSTYKDAYMSLSAPSIFSPFVRLELLKWDPLHEKTDFLNMNWHNLLMDYGLPEDGSGFAPDDADANLVPELVEKVAIPILHHEVVHCWDTLSTEETKNAVGATSLVTDYVPAQSKALSDLLVAIRTRLADAVANLMVPTWSPLVLQAVPNASRVAAYRFGVSVRLLKNICSWKDILSLPLLEKLALDDLLCAKVLPHLRSIAPNVHDAITRTERMVSSLSGVWADPDATVYRSQKLQPLVDYMMLLRNMLEKKHGFEASGSEATGLARRLIKMLVLLNEYDKARDTARIFHLKDAL